MHQPKRDNARHTDLAAVGGWVYDCSAVVACVFCGLLTLILAHNNATGAWRVPLYDWSPLSCFDNMESEARLALSDSCTCLYRLLRERIDDCNGVRQSVKDRVTLNHPDHGKLKVPEEPWDFSFRDSGVIFYKPEENEDGNISEKFSWLSYSLQCYLNQTQDLNVRYRLYILERARIRYMELTESWWYWGVSWLKYFKLISHSYDLCEC